MFLLLTLACTTPPVTDGPPSDTAADTATDSATDSAAPPPAFTEVHALLEAGCGTCHMAGYVGTFLVDGDPAGTYDLLLNAAPHVDPDARYVVPADPDASLLTHKLTAQPSFGDPMPPPDSYATPLTEAEIALLRTWIQGGAPGP